MEALIKSLCLPPGYTYYDSSSEIEIEKYGITSIRVKEIVDKESAEKWLADLQTNSFITWRVATTYPTSQRINIHKVDLRCQHLTDKRAHASRKNTDCPAKLQIVVRRFVKNSRSKNVDLLVERFPCIINFKGTHNHTINDAEALKFRDVYEDMKGKLRFLIGQGHSAASALDSLQTDFLLEHGENCCKDPAGVEMFNRLESLLEQYNQDTKQVGEQENYKKHCKRRRAGCRGSEERKRKIL